MFYCRMKEAGIPFTKEAAMAKYFTSEVNLYHVRYNQNVLGTLKSSRGSAPSTKHKM